MAEEIIFKISADASNAETETQSLEASLEAVNEAAKEVMQSTEGVQDQFNTLRKDTASLTKEVDDLDKEYKALVKSGKDIGQVSAKLKELTDKKTELGALNAEYDELIKNNTDLSATFEDVHGELQPLSTRISEAEDRMHQLALEGKQTSQEYRDLVTEVVTYKQAIVSTDKEVDRLVESGRGLGAALQIGSTVVAGYGAIQGVQALVGSENEALEKTFIKLQAVQTILASLEQLKLALDKQSIIVTNVKAAATWLMTAAQAAWTFATGLTTTAMVALKIAMLAIPIVALIAGIVAVVAIIKKFSAATETAEKENIRLSASLAQVTEQLRLSDSAAKKSVDNRLKLAKATGASIEEVHQLELESLKVIEEERKHQLDLAKEQNMMKIKSGRKAAKEGNKEQADGFLKEAQAAKSKYDDLRQLDNDYYLNRTVLIADHNKEVQEEEKKAQEKSNQNWKRARDKRKSDEEQARELEKDRERLFTDLMLSNIEDAELRKLSILNESHKREQADLIQKFGEDTMLLAQLEVKQGEELAKATKDIENKREAEKNKLEDKEIEADKLAHELRLTNARAQLEGELIQMRNNFDKKQEIERELAAFELEQALLQENITEGEKFKVKELYAQKIAILDEQEAARKIEIESQTAAAVKSVYDSSFTAISSLADGIFAVRIANAEEGSRKELEIQKRQFKFNKAMQIANATMQGIQAVQSTFASAAASPITPLFPAYPYIAAAGAGAAALGNLLKIKATTFQGGGSIGSTSVNPPSVSIPTEDEGTEDTTTLTSGLQGSGTSNTVSIVDSQIKQALLSSQDVEILSKVG